MSTKITFELLLDTFENLGFEVYPNYSGRGMYGKKCVGVIFSDSLALNVAMVTLELMSRGCNSREIERLFSSSATDSLGIREILYFPRIETPEYFKKKEE